MSVFVPEGKEKALLIDTGIGIGNIRQKIEELTDKPLIVVMGHGDHTGGSGWTARRRPRPFRTASPMSRPPYRAHPHDDGHIQSRRFF